MTLHKCEMPCRPQKIKKQMPTLFSNTQQEQVDRNVGAGTSAGFYDFIMREYLYINISMMEQIVASSVAESVVEDNTANSHDPRHLCL